MSLENRCPLILSHAKVLEILDNKWEDLINVVEKALASYSAGKVVQPLRTVLPIEDHGGLLLSMPAYNVSDNALAVKLLTSFSQNRSIGLPVIQSTVLLYEPTTGSLKAIMDGEVITNMRTAAASAVATKYLARPDSKILAILGAGQQARSHYDVLSKLYNFEEIRVWNIHVDTAEKLVNEIRSDGKNAHYCPTAKECVNHADIILTATIAEKPVLEVDWIKPGAHINAVGAPVPTHQELSKDIMTTSVIYVDSRTGANAESGDIIISEAEIYAEIGEVILGIKDVVSHNKTTIFKSLGMAIEDVAAAKLVYDIYESTLPKK